MTSSAESFRQRVGLHVLRFGVGFVLLSLCIALDNTDDFEFPSAVLQPEHWDYTELFSHQNDSSFIFKYCNVYCDGLVKKKIKRYEFELIPQCSYCNCDEHCHRFRDCCPDVNGTFPARGTYDYRHICVWNTDDVKVSAIYGIAMLLSCEESSEPNDGESIPGTSMEGSMPLQPVTSLVTHISYYNQHIAKCNGENSFKFWEEYDCFSGAGSGSGADDVDGDYSTIHDDSCQYTFSSALGAHPRMCDPMLSSESYMQSVDTCNLTGLWATFDADFVTNCRSVYYPVWFNYTVYRNIFCYLCNGLTPKMVDIGTALKDKPEYVPRITIITRFKLWPIIDSWREPTHCKRNSRWDPVKKMCRLLYCLSGRVLKNDVCLPINDDAFGDIYSFDVTLRPRDSQTRTEARDWTLLTEMMMSYFQIKMSELALTNYVFTLSVDLHSVLRLSCKLLVTEHTNRTDLETRLHSLVSEQWETTFMGEYYLFTSSISEDSDFSFTNKSTFWSDPFSGMCCNLVDDSFELKPLNTTSTGNTIIVNEYLSCPYVKLDAKDIETHSSGWIRITYANVSLPKTYLLFHASGEVGICFDTLIAAYNESGVSDISFEPDSVVVVQNLLSFVCVTVSLLCLACTFITYCVFPTLQTLPAKNNMFLVANLFLAQLLFQFGIDQTQHRVTCIILGIAIHYLWLKVVLWMNVCSFHMFRVFVCNSKRSGPSSRSKDLIRYVVYTNLVSLIIIGVTIGVSMVISQGQDIGYGGHACYLSSPVRVGFAFVLPLSIVLCSNILFFVFTVYSISKIDHIKRQTGKERQNIYVYVKLSTLTGMFWTVSILSEILDIEALSYIAIVLNGSQGLLLFVCYALNRRVLTLWKGVCMNVFPRNGSTKTRSTSSTCA